MNIMQNLEAEFIFCIFEIVLRSFGSVSNNFVSMKRPLERLQTIF